MDNNSTQRPRKRVSRKVLRRRQLTALAIIALLVLLIVILIAKCAKSDDSEVTPSDVQTTTTTTVTAEITTEATTTTTEAVTTVNPAAAQVVLSKREMFLDIGDVDVSIISVYPDGSTENNEVWKSSDEKIASVDDKGYVTAKSAGECYIILSFDNNPGVEIEIKVSVADDGSSPSVESTTSISDDPEQEGV